jgi:uroporphyrinogen-III synthase
VNAGLPPDASASPSGAVRPCVVVTRPQPQADEWVARFIAAGLPARAVPLLGIADAADPAAVAGAWHGLAGHALAMFVSPSAVERFFARRPDGVEAWPAAVLAGSTGPGTHAALLRAGVPPDLIVTPPVSVGRFDSEALWKQLARRGGWAGSQVLVVRGEGGRDWLADTLRREGARVHFIEAYRRTAPVLDVAAAAALQAACEAPAAHCWLFSSSEAAHHLPGLAPAQSWAASWALATHDRIAEAARAVGFGRVDRVDPTPQAVLSHITRALQSARP